MRTICEGVTPNQEGHHHMFLPGWLFGASSLCMCGCDPDMINNMHHLIIIGQRQQVARHERKILHSCKLLCAGITELKDGLHGAT